VNARSPTLAAASGRSGWPALWRLETHLGPATLLYAQLANTERRQRSALLPTERRHRPTNRRVGFPAVSDPADPAIAMRKLPMIGRIVAG